MIVYDVFNATNRPSVLKKNQLVDFLFISLQEYGDPKKDILAAIDYALKESISFGGVIITAQRDSEIIGAVVVNKTGMGGYIPENILVYIATHENERGNGIGGELMKRTMSLTNGDIALHVEKSNPAIKLYEKLGFTTPYLEMRYKRK